MDVVRRIAEVRRGESRGSRVVVLDDGREIELSARRIRQEGLAPGEALDSQRLDQILRDDARERAHEVALRLLAYGPRTEHELALRLRQRGFDPETTEREVQRMRMAGLLNDARYAESWVEIRQRSAPRSPRALAGELRARGIDRRTAESATAGIDELSAGLALAEHHAPRVAGLDPETRRRRLGALLQRRGFSYSVIESVLRQIEDGGAARR